MIGPHPERPKQRRGRQGRSMSCDTFFLPLWGDKPIGEITRAQVQTAIKGVRDYRRPRHARTHTA